jgi:hypothetical protein
MDCLRSFSFTAGANENVTGTDINTWGTGSDTYWTAQIGITTTSQFNIQGFKNINVFGIQAVGDVNSIISTANGVIVNNWNFLVRLNGQNATIGNTITTTPNRFSIVTQTINPIIGLSRYNPRIDFPSGIQSVQSIEVYGLQASGHGAENSTTINLSWNMVFNVFYKFEGE